MPSSYHVIKTLIICMVQALAMAEGAFIAKPGYLVTLLCGCS